MAVSCFAGKWRQEVDNARRSLIKTNAVHQTQATAVYTAHLCIQTILGRRQQTACNAQIHKTYGSVSHPLLLGCVVGRRFRWDSRRRSQQAALTEHYPCIDTLRSLLKRTPIPHRQTEATVTP